MNALAPAAATVRVRLTRILTRPGQRAAGLAVLCVVTLVWFAPLVTSLNSSVLERQSDATSAMHALWLAQHEHSTPFTLSRDPYNGAPEGTPLLPSVNIASPLQPGFTWALAPVVGLVASVNVFLLLGFVLTSFAMFAFLLGRAFGFFPSLVAGYVVAFNPWTFERAYAGHAAFLHGWCLVLVLAALVRALERRTLRAAAVAGAAYGLCFLVAAYFGLVASAFVLAALGIAVWRGRHAGERRRTLGLVAVATAVAILPLLPGLIAYANDKTATAQTLSNPSVELGRLGASPLASYLAPSPRHPVLGSIGRDLRPSDPHDEKILFFGYVTLALAAYAVWLLIRRRESLPRPWRMPMTVAAISAPIAFLLSLPRTLDVFGVAIPTPTYALGVFTSFYRVYARVGYVVGIAAALLAAAALARLLTRRRGPLIVALLAGAIVFELLPGRVSTFGVGRAPDYDAWLAQQPRGIVAHYPLATDDKPARDLAELEYYNVRFTRQPLYAQWGGGIGGTREDGIRILSRHLIDDTTPRILAAEGVRYVVVHPDVYEAEGLERPQLGPAYRLLKSFGDVQVFALNPVEAIDVDALLRERRSTLGVLQGLLAGKVRYGGGFYPGEHYDYDKRNKASGLWRWMSQNGELAVDNPNGRTLAFKLSGLGFSTFVDREVSLVDSAGKVLGTTRIHTGLAPFAFDAVSLPKGRSVLNLEARPGPQSLGGSDDRLGSIFISPVSLLPLADLSVSLRAK